MARDSDPITAKKSTTDFTSIVVDTLSTIEYKLVMLLFFIFMIVMSDVFTGRILSRFNNAVEYKYATNYGTALQGMFICLFYIIADMGVKSGLL